MIAHDYSKYMRKEKLIKYLFLWPTLLILLFLIAYPFITLIYYSFFPICFKIRRPCQAEFCLSLLLAYVLSEGSA